MLLGIDIGTSGTKTVLFDLQGKTIASATEEYPLYQPENGWAEQEPADWWNAVCVSIQRTIINANINPDEIKSIGLSGQMHGLVMLDKEDNVLCRSIIWCDGRTERECAEITELVGREKLIEISANPALPAFTASKIRWIQNNRPEIFEKCCKIMLPKDYIRYMLTGEFATEVSDASGMQLMNISKREWSKELLQLFGIDIQQLPKMYESFEISGKINSFAAKQTGLKVGTPVVGGGGDQAAGGVGNGVVEQGLISVTIGSSGVVFAHTDTPQIDKFGRLQSFCHCVPNSWHVMGVTQAAGLSLKWFRDNFCGEEIEKAQNLGIDSYVLLDSLAAESGIGANKLIYLPYLMGERTPHLDSYARGVFFGLSAIHKKGDMIRAIMEGVGFSLMDCLCVINEMGINSSIIRASGGGGRSPLWRQILTDIFQNDVETLSSSEGPALGVALLAAVGIGEYNSVGEACKVAISTRNKTSLNENSSAKYEKNYSLYKNLYKSLKEDFKKL